MADVKTEMISFQADGNMATGYLARPDDDARHPGVVVIQEWWGLDDHIKDVTSRLASEGYVALAPDLYHGNVMTNPEEAREAAMGTDRAQALKELLASVSHLRSIGTGNVGVIGFCMGGAYSLRVAMASGDIQAAVPWYGRNPDPVSELSTVTAPVLAFYGAEDQGIPPSMAAELEAELKKAGTPVETHVYQGAGHAFLNDTKPSYNEEASKDAWSRTLAFFAKQLSAA